MQICQKNWIEVRGIRSVNMDVTTIGGASATVPLETEADIEVYIPGDSSVPGVRLEIKATINAPVRDFDAAAEIIRAALARLI